MIDYPAILTREYPEVAFIQVGDEYEGIQFLTTPHPSKSELDAAWDGVRADIAAEQDAKVSAKQSAVAKLKALGLSTEEVETLIK
jgi:hypothetical protein